MLIEESVFTWDIERFVDLCFDVVSFVTALTEKFQKFISALFKIVLLVLKNGSCEHTTNDLPTFSPQKRDLEIGPSERLLPIFGTKNRTLTNGSCERALTLKAD